MSIASQLTALANNKAAIKAAITAKNPSVMPTDALSQWPTSIASISGGGALPYDAELDYVTFPAGSYVDPGIVDTGYPGYDLEVTFRLPSNFALSQTSFRFGNWRGEQTNSFMIWPDTQSGSTLRIDVAQYCVTPNTGYIQLGEFITIKAKQRVITYNGTTFNVSPNTSSIYTTGKFIICGLWMNGSSGGSESDIDLKGITFYSPLADRELIPVRKGQVGYLYDKTLKQLFGSGSSVALVPGPDKVEAES